MNPPRLRLISASSRVEDSPARGAARALDVVMAPHGFQLGLPFEGDGGVQRILIVAMDEIHGSQFLALLRSVRPKAVVDLRHLIRFDLPGTNRDEVFYNLSHLRSLYVNASVPWHQLRRQDLISNDTSISQRLDHEVVERQDSPLVLLTAKKSELFEIAAYLNRSLSTRSNRAWKIEQAE